MAKIKKVQHIKTVEEKIEDAELSDAITYEDFNKEKPLPNDPEFNISKKDILTEGPTKVYTCSIHTKIQSDKPGTCSECGKTLVEKK
jgi:hypothetical protein